MRGFFSSYCEGLALSKIPPCGGALFSGVAEAVAAASVAMLAMRDVIAAARYLRELVWVRSGEESGILEAYFEREKGRKNRDSLGRSTQLLHEAQSQHQQRAKEEEREEGEISVDSWVSGRKLPRTSPPSLTEPKAK